MLGNKESKSYEDIQVFMRYQEEDTSKLKRRTGKEFKHDDVQKPYSLPIKVYNSIVSLFMIYLPIQLFIELSEEFGILGGTIVTTVAMAMVYVCVALINMIVLMASDNDDNLIEGTTDTLFYIPKQVYKLYRSKVPTKFEREYSSYYELVRNRYLSIPRHERYLFWGNSYGVERTRGGEVLLEEQELMGNIDKILESLNNEIILYSENDGKDRNIGYVTRYYNILVSDEDNIYETTSFKYLNNIYSEDTEKLKLLCDVPKLTRESVKDWYEKQKQTHLSFKQMAEVREATKNLEQQTQKTDEVLEFIRKHKDDYDKVKNEVSGNFSENYIQNKLEKEKRELEKSKQMLLENNKAITDSSKIQN